MASVLFLSLMNSAAWGGSEEIWYHTALRLAKSNYSVGVCCFSWPGKEDKIQILENAGCKIFLLPGRMHSRGLLRKFQISIKLRAIPFNHYEKIIVNQGGWKDIVHGPYKTLNKILPSYTLLFHNYDETDHLSKGKKNLFHNWINKAEKNIGDAGRIFTGIKKSTDIEVPRQEVLFNPITFSQAVNVTPFSSSPESKLIFAMLAELDVKRKAQDLLLKTLATDKWQERNYELHFYGKGKDHAYLENLIKEKQLSTKVFLKGFTKNVQDVLTNSHIILQITHFDAMPIAVTEALAVARSVIVSNVGDMPLWVKNDVNGWVATEATQNEIDSVLEKAWRCRSRLEEMGRNSFKIFKEKYPADPIEFFLKQAGIIKD